MILIFTSTSSCKTSESFADTDSFYLVFKFINNLYLYKTEANTFSLTTEKTKATKFNLGPNNFLKINSDYVNIRFSNDDTLYNIATSPTLVNNTNVVVQDKEYYPPYAAGKSVLGKMLVIPITKDMSKYLSLYGGLTNTTWKNSLVADTLLFEREQ